jgi:hypothetical protein
MDLKNLKYKKTDNHRRLVLMIILAVVIVLGLLYFVGVFIKNKTLTNIVNSKKEKTPTEILKDLESSSKPVTTTLEERGKELNALQKTSTPVKLTDKEKLEMLKNLSNK